VTLFRIIEEKKLKQHEQLEKTWAVDLTRRRAVEQKPAIKESFLYFVHIPKTGGLYVKRKAFPDYPNVSWWGKFSGKKYDHHPCALRKPINLGTNNRNQSHSYVDDEWFKNPNSLVFAIVRNPFDLYVSLYKTHQTKGTMSFEDYIKRTCQPDFFEPKSIFVVESTPFMFYQIFNDESDCTCDLILRTEFLDGSLLQVFEEMNLDIPDEIHKSSVIKTQERTSEFRKEAERDYRLFYNDELRELVENRRALELEMFGYNFDGISDMSNQIIVPSMKYDFSSDYRWEHLKVI